MTKRLEGLSILAVEDSPINQMVLENILGTEGAEIDIASDGQQAIDRVRQRGPNYFHLVLMDIQMPFIDGYEAARQLHRLSPHLPIIGQTANTLPLDREKCLAANMVDYITKPLDPPSLVQCILQHARPDTLTDPPPRNGSATTPSSKATVDDRYVQWAELESRYAHQPIFINQLLNVFLNGNTRLVDQLRQALKQQDDRTWAGLVHGLKGMAGSIAAHRLAMLSQMTEQMAKQGLPERAQRGEELVQCLEETLHQVKHYLQR